MKQFVIWDNSYDTIRSLADDLIENGDAEEFNAYEIAEDTNAEHLLDAEIELNIEVGDDIIVIGYLQLWDGNHTGWRDIHSQNIGDCLHTHCGDYVSYYVDDLGDLCCKDVHHDGTNHYVYRAWKAGISTDRKLRFLDKVARNQVTRRDITNCTRRLGEYVADVYGWTLKGMKAV